MKRSKLLVLTSLILAMLMLFSACGKSENLLGKILVDDTAYTDSTPAYTVGEKISDLSGATVDSSLGELILLKKDVADEAGKTKYMVYNLDKNSIVWSETQTAKLGLSVTLDTLYIEDETVSYFTVQATTLDPEDSAVKPSTTTTLYTASAEQLATVEAAVSVEEIGDLLYFDGKCYRASKDGSIAYAFDYSTLAKIPDVEKYNGIYYEVEDEYVVTYNDKLEFLAKYRLPVHIEDDGEVTCMVPLENGNIFLQYIYKADPYADEYTFITEGTKYILVTQLVNVKKGTAKEIDCEYVFEGAYNLILSAENAKKEGIDTKQMPVYGSAYLIEDQRLSVVCCVTVDNKGKITEIGTVNGDPISYFTLFTDNRWIVHTDGYRYLVDEDGKVIGDVTEASRFGRFFYKDGKIYDATLSVIYDYRTNKQTVKRTVGDSLLMADTNGRILLYTGSGDPTVLIDKDSEKTYVEGYGRYVVVKDGEKLEIYNELGVLLGTVNDVNGSVSAVTSTDGAVLLQMTTPAGENVFYRLG